MGMNWETGQWEPDGPESSPMMGATKEPTPAAPPGQPAGDIPSLLPQWLFGGTSPAKPSPYTIGEDQIKAFGFKPGSPQYNLYKAFITEAQKAQAVRHEQQGDPRRAFIAAAIAGAAPQIGNAIDAAQGRKPIASTDQGKTLMAYALQMQSQRGSADAQMRQQLLAALFGGGQGEIARLMREQNAQKFLTQAGIPGAGAQPVAPGAPAQPQGTMPVAPGAAAPTPQGVAPGLMMGPMGAPQGAYEPPPMGPTQATGAPAQPPAVAPPVPAQAAPEPPPPPQIPGMLSTPQPMVSDVRPVQAPTTAPAPAQRTPYNFQGVDLERYYGLVRRISSGIADGSVKDPAKEMQDGLKQIFDQSDVHQGRVTLSKKSAEGRIEDHRKALATIEEGWRTGSTTEGLLDTFEAALKRQPTGTGTGLWSTVSGALGSLGIDMKKLGLGPSATDAQIMKAVSLQLIKPLQQAAKGSQSDREFAAMLSAMPSVENTPQANAILMRAMREQIALSKRLYEEAVKFEKDGGPAALSSPQWRAHAKKVADVYGDAFKKMREEMEATAKGAKGGKKAEAPSTPAAPGKTPAGTPVFNKADAMALPEGGIATFNGGTYEKRGGKLYPIGSAFAGANPMDADPESIDARKAPDKAGMLDILMGNYQGGKPLAPPGSAARKIIDALSSGGPALSTMMDGLRRPSAAPSEGAQPKRFERPPFIWGG